MKKAESHEEGGEAQLTPEQQRRADSMDIILQYLKDVNNSGHPEDFFPHVPEDLFKR